MSKKKKQKIKEYQKNYHEDKKYQCSIQKNSFDSACCDLVIPQ